MSTSLPHPYSNIYPEDPEDCCHYVCYTPSTQPGGGRPNHQPVYTADQMREYARTVAIESVRLYGEKLLEAADEWAEYVEADSAPMTLRKYLERAVE